MNLFARELVRVMGIHGKYLGSLFSLKVPDPGTGGSVSIPQSKVTRLQRSLSEPISATLNAAQLDALEQAYGLTADERARLNAALVAEAVRALFMDRIEYARAEHLGEVALALMLGQSDDELRSARDALISGTRGLDASLLDRSTVREATLQATGGPLGEDAATLSLEPAYELYEQGQLWIEVARETRSPGIRRGHRALAQQLLEQAQEQTRLASRQAQGSAVQRELQNQITSALRDASQIL